MLRESTCDRVWLPLIITDWSLSGFRDERKGVRDMTAYEIISIFLGVLSLLIAFGSLLIAIIAFLDRKNKRK